MMADDVVFTIMATGQEHHGRDGVMGMLTCFYHIAFDATAITCVALFGESNAMNDQIKHGRVYFEMPALLQQLGVQTG